MFLLRGTDMKCFEKVNAENFNNIKDIAHEKFVLAQSYGYAY